MAPYFVKVFLMREPGIKEFPSVDTSTVGSSETVRRVFEDSLRTPCMEILSLAEGRRILITYEAFFPVLTSC